MNKRPVLFLTYRLAMGFGVELVVMELTKRLRAEGHKVFIGTTEVQEPHTSAESVYLVPDVSSVEALLADLPDDVLIVAHTSPYFEMLPQLKQKGYECWAYEHGDPSPEMFIEDRATRQNIRSNKSLHVYPRIDRVVAISDFIKHDINWPKADIVLNGCDHVPLPPFKALEDVSQHGVKVGFLFRMGKGEAKYKGNELYMRLAELCRLKDIPGLELHVAGRGTEEDVMEFRRLGMIPHLNISDEEKTEYLRSLDIFVSLSLWEGCNLPLLEAQALGTLCITLDTGAHPEFCPHIAANLQAILPYLTKAATDRTWLKEASCAASKFVRSNFTWDKTFSSFRELMLPAPVLVSDETISAVPLEIVNSLFAPDLHTNEAHYAVWQNSFDSWGAVQGQNRLLAEHLFPMSSKVSLVIMAEDIGAPTITKFIKSCRIQSYPVWEIVVVVPEGQDLQSSPLHKYTEEDIRIRTLALAKPGTSSQHMLQAALPVCTGDYLFYIGVDCLLHPDALFEIVRAAVTRPDAVLIYADEDKLLKSGERVSPHFKPDWNPDMFAAYNYIGEHPIFKKTSLAQFFEAADCHPTTYDLLLDFITILDHPRTQIIHVPKPVVHILYSKKLEASALPVSESPAHSRFATKHLGEHCRFDYDPELNVYHQKVELPLPVPHVTLLIPTKDNVKHLRPCLESILSKTTYPSFDILVINNNSSDVETCDFLRTINDLDGLKVLDYTKPFNYSAINNFAVRHARGEFIALVNDDIEILTPDWLQEMVSLAMRPRTGCVGAKLYYPNRTIQHAGVVLGIHGLAGHSHKHYPEEHSGYFNRLKITHNYTAVTAACLVIRKSVYEEVGGLEEDHLAVAFNDVEFCIRVWKHGYWNVWTPHAEFIHHESVSRGHDSESKEKRARGASEANYVVNLHSSILRHDPCYSLNLSNNSEDFAYKRGI